MYKCTDCGCITDKYFNGDPVCEDCARKRNESQDERRHEGDEKHDKR
jgi:hypothetical protein